MQRMLLIAIVLTSTVLSGIAVGAPNQTLAYQNNHVYFRLDSSAASIKGTRDNVDSTIATIRLMVKFEDSLYQNDTLNDIYARVTFNDSLLQFIDGHRDTINWSADSVALDTFRLDGTGAVRIVMKQGARPVPKDSFKVYAYLRFYPKCQIPGRMDTLIITPTSSITYISTMRNRINNQFYPPSDASHFGVGRILAKHASGTFSIGSATVSNATGNEFWIPVLSSRNANLYVAKHYITWDSTRLQYLDWAQGDHEWSMAFPEPLDGGLFSFIGLGNCFPETTLDTLYKIKFRLLCGGTPQRTDTLRFTFTDTGAFYNRCLCSRQDQNTFVRGYIYRRDSARLGGTIVSSVNSVGQTSTSSDVVKYRISLLNTFTSGIRSGGTNDTGIVLNVDLRRRQLTTVTSNYFDSTLGMTYNKEANDTVVSAIQVFNSGGGAVNARAVSASLAHLLYLKLKWDGTDTSYHPDWNDRYIRTKFDAARGSLKTVVPDTSSNGHCFRTVSDSGLTFATMDSIPIRMGQFVSPAAYSTARCVNQDVRIRANFTLDSFKVKVYVDSAVASIHGLVRVMDSVTATRNSAYTYTLSANAGFAALSNPDTLIATFRIDRSNCIGSSPDLGLRFSTQINNVFSTVGEEYHATASHGTATATCQNYCQEDKERIVNVPTENSKYSLDQNSPNPFNPITTINLNLPVASKWKIMIFNVAGQLVREFSGDSPAGSVTVSWDASRYASGVYIYRAVAGDFVATRKMVLLK